MNEVFSDPRSRGPDLEILLEVAGLAVDSTANADTNFSLFIPHNLRLQGAEGSEHRDPRPWKWIDGADYLVWNTVEEVAIDPRVARELLFNLAESADVVPEGILEFTKIWGVPQPPPWDERDLEMYLHGEWSCPLDQWEDFATNCDALLRMLALSAKGELADEDLLQVFFDSFSVEQPQSLEAALESGLTLREHWNEWFELRQAQWRYESAPARRLELQRRLIENKLNGLMQYQRPVFIWDERGRRFEREAGGVWEIALSQLQEVFVAPVVGVLICSMCGKAYEFEEGPERRRPRSGVRNFCSDKCRRAAKRESNRQSWQRNGAKWRPPGSRAPGKRRDDGQTR